MLTPLLITAYFCMYCMCYNYTDGHYIFIILDDRKLLTGAGHYPVGTVRSPSITLLCQNVYTVFTLYKACCSRSFVTERGFCVLYVQNMAVKFDLLQLQIFSLSYPITSS